MSKRTTKADIVLQGLRDRLTVAEADVRSATETLRLAEAIRDEVGRTYNQMEKALIRKPAAPKQTPKAPKAAKQQPDPPATDAEVVQ